MLALHIIESLDPHMLRAYVFTRGQMLTPHQMSEHQLVTGEQPVASGKWTSQLLFRP
jgi:hypothetical protein